MNQVVDGKKGAGGISDAAVKAATGKSWKQWFALLDQCGAKGMSHKEIVAVVRRQADPGPWWRQMVTVGYEQERGLREKHQTPQGFQAGCSRTLGAPLPRLYRHWHDRKLRALWLDDPDFVIRKATRDGSLRITWVDGRTSVEVNFVEKGPARSQVAVQHRKLPNARSVSRMKSYWARQLDRLKQVLEPR